MEKLKKILLSIFIVLTFIWVSILAIGINMTPPQDHPFTICFKILTGVWLVGIISIFSSILIREIWSD